MENRNIMFSKNRTVADAMRHLGQVQPKILCITEGEKLIGTLTDGDVRRFLLAGGSLEQPVSLAANPMPQTAQSILQAAAIYQKSDYAAIPVLDQQGRITDIYMGDGTEKKQHRLDVPVVINSGGKGSRLDPFTRILPKPLIPVGDLPILEHIMHGFRNFGCDRFHVIVNYKKALIKAYFSEDEKPFDITFYDEDKSLGTGGGLSLLNGKLNETFFFTNCDILLQSDFDSILQFHRKNGNAVTMVCAHKNLTIPYGVIEMGENGSIRAMKEKPEMSFLTNTGLYIVEPEVLNDIPQDTAAGFPDIIEQQRQKGRNVAVYPVSEEEWMDMGQLKELEKMRERLIRQ